LGAVQKPQAPVSDLGFYSAAEQAAMNLQRSKGTGQSFLNDLMKAPDVKKDELQYTGLDEFLKDKPNVTRQEVTDYLSKNKVDVQEVQLGGNVVEDSVGVAKRKAVFDKYEPEIQALYKEMDSFGYETPRERLQSTDNRLRKLQEIRDREADAAYVIPEPIPTKFSQFTLPGGENYREILLKLPEKMPKTLPEGYSLQSMADGNFTLVNPDNIGTRIYAKSKDAAMEEAIRRFTIKEEPYRSSHFNEPNILAHMRVNDRVDADGKKMLLVEEIQSDWHQAGRTKGYKGADAAKAEQEFNTYSSELARKYGLNPEQNLSMYATLKGIKPEEVQKYDQLQSAWVNSSGGVPDAPFKDNWYQLSLKRLVKYAADNGYDRIGLTTGRQQAERYNLSSQVNQIVVTPRMDAATGEKTRSVAVDLKTAGILQLGVDKNGIVDNARGGFDNPAQFKGKPLADIIGKEMAQKIMDSERATFEGAGLNVGGEGMKKYYDEIYPKYLEKYGKKFDAKVGETRIKTGNAYAQTKGIPAEETVRYIDITPKMKEGTSKGQPLFAAVPAGTLVGGEIDYTDPFANTIDDTTR
jgi:hypothetical protein